MEVDQHPQGSIGAVQPESHARETAGAVNVLVEGCVESLESSLAAVQGGAQRLELCDDLSVGGITPSVELLDAVKRAVDVPVFVMIRPRGGPYEYSKAELDHMRRDIAVAKQHG